MTKFESLKDNFKNALNGFSDSLEEKKTEYVRDSAIKRFEITFELAWKAIKASLEKRGVICSSPRECFKEAYKQGLINYEDVFLEALSERNYTAHIYSEQFAESIYSRLPKLAKAFVYLQEVLEKEN